MASLAFGVAQRVAASLVTVGHPYQPAAIDATAMDLVKWCVGYFGGAGRAISPEQQAEQLVEHVRLNWEQWPEKGGTKRLKEEFERMFPARAAVAAPPGIASMIERGLLPKPCIHCPPDAPYCEYQGEAGHAKELEDEKYWLAERARDHTPKPRDSRIADRRRERVNEVLEQLTEGYTDGDSLPQMSKADLERVH